MEQLQALEELFETYLQSASEILSDQVAGSDGRKPFYEYLNTRMPRLTKEEYISRHKSVVEYIVRLAKEKLAEKVKREESAQ